MPDMPSRYMPNWYGIWTWHIVCFSSVRAQMLLLDRAIKLAAEQDEPDHMNFVRKHAKQQVRMRSHAFPCLPASDALATGRCWDQAQAIQAEIINK